MKLLNKLFQLKPGEGKKVLPFFISFFFAMGSFVFGRTARDTFFLSRFDPAYLPHMMILMAFTVGITVAFMTRVSKRIPILPQIIGTYLVGVLSFILIQLLLADWIYPVLYLWFEIFGTIMMIQFWLYTSMAFTTREAKRLFGLIASGAAISNTILGFSMTEIINTFSTNFLLPATSICIGVSLVAIIFSAKHGQAPTSVSSITNKKSNAEKVSLGTSPYLKVMTLTIGLSAIVGALIDYQMKIIISDNLTETEMASLFGTLYGFIGVISIFMQFFVSGRLISRFGILWALMLLPVALFVGSAMIFILPIAIFGVIAKAGDQVFRFTIHDLSSQLLWLPVSPQEKNRAKPFIDGTIKNAAAGIAGLIILGLFYFVDDIRLLSIPSIIMLVVWLIANFKLKNGYVMELRKAIEKRSLDFEELEIDVTDPEIVETIKKTLSTGDEYQKMFALDSMSDLPLMPWKEDILNLFNNGSPIMKGKILIMTSKAPEIISDELITPLIDHKDDLLSARAMISIGIRQNGASASKLMHSLNGNNDTRKAAAAASLILMGDQAEVQANDTIKQMLFDQNNDTQLAALNSVGHIQGILPDTGLVTLLDDDSPDVRGRAAQLANARSDKILIPPLIMNLDNPLTYPASRRALRSFDEANVSEQISDVLENIDSDKNLVIGAIRTVRDYRKFSNLKTIISLAKSNDGDIAKEAIESLFRLARQDPLPDSILNQTEFLLKELSRQTYIAFGQISLFAGNDKAILINDYLSNFINKKKELILKLSLMPFPDSPIETYQHALLSGDLSARSNALEILDNLLPIETREIVMPLFDELDIKEKIEKGTNFVDSISSNKEIVKQWLYSQEDWLTAIALDYKLHNLNEAWDINWKRVSKGPKVQELCSSSLTKNDSPLKTLTDFPLKEFKLHDISMYSTLEKTIFMKGVDLFHDISGEEVSHVAQIAEEIEFSTGDVIFEEGDVGDSMFIIIDGSVKIHKGDKEIATLSKGKFIGEMALLDQEPRSASVTATVDTILLQINREDFYDLMASRMEIMQGIVKILTQRLRSAIA